MKNVRMIGEGNTAQVVELSQKFVAKLFYEHVSDSSINHEYMISKAIRDASLPAPNVYRCKRIDEKRAIIYQKIDGATLTDKLVSEPWEAHKSMRLMAQLHLEVHNKNLSSLPSQRAALLRNIHLGNKLNPEVKRKILNVLDTLQEGESVCHGDFHPDNILLSEKGPIIIDWADATKGNRLADLARTILILRYGGMSSNASLIKKTATLSVRKWLAGIYLKSYRKQYDFSKDFLAKWMLPVAAARLSEKLPDIEKHQLMSMIQKLCNET